MKLTEPFPRLDHAPEIREKILPLCRLSRGEVWEDPEKGHRVSVCDAESPEEIAALMGREKAVLGIHDPPYNLKVGKKKTVQLFRIATEDYIDFSRQWIQNSVISTADNSHLYIWLGADQREGFQPLPEFMIMMREFPVLESRSLITVRNQRGYGTQKNWMCIRQELLYYTKGRPDFSVVYTDIPKVLKGYYKIVNGEITENLERSKSGTIRPGNVWLDIQQVFYRMEENVPGAYAQKPLSAIDRIIQSSSRKGDLIIDFFAHSGTTLISAEKHNRVCYTCDLDPVFAEITIRRLLHFRETGKSGWQCENPFPELSREFDLNPSYPARNIPESSSD